MKRSKKNHRRNFHVVAMLNRHSKTTTKMRHRCARRQKDVGRIREEYDY